jgi:uncharacterized protein YyaL (SSP411 family)
MAQNLVRLWRLTGSDFYRADVDAILEAAGGAIAGNLFATAGLLNALDLRLGAIDVAIVVPPGTDAGAMLRQARDAATPGTVITLHAGDADLPADHPAAGKGAAGGRPTAYICHGETCSLPVTDPAALAALIRPETGAQLPAL